MDPKYVVLDFIKIGVGTRYRVIDTTKQEPANEHGVYDNKHEADALCEALNAKEAAPWNDPEHQRLVNLNAAHLVAAAIILSSQRRVKPSVTQKAKEFANSAAENLKGLGYLPDQAQPIEDGAPDFLSDMTGKDVGIPHESEGFRWRVKASFYQEVFNAAYPDPWV